MIQDEDFSVKFPVSQDGLSIKTTVPETSAAFPPSNPSIQPLIDVTRTVTPVSKALNNVIIPSSTLHILDSQHEECLATLLRRQQLHTDDYLDPHALSLLLYLQNIRLILHRHNLSPVCPPDVRLTAIDRCVTISKETAGFLLRSIPSLSKNASQEPPVPSVEWNEKIKSTSSGFRCTHLWRCCLFLCFQNEFIPALICARASAAIGDNRRINIACGRHLDFFLQYLLAKFKAGVTGSRLEQDEEMMAYVSGDLQANISSAWIWQHEGSEDKSSAKVERKSQSPISQIMNPMNDMSAATSTPTFGVGMQESSSSSDWIGWDGLLSILERLASEQRQQQQQLQDHSPTSASSAEERPAKLPKIQLDSPRYLTPQIVEAGTPQISSPGGSNRISIADII